MTIAPIFLPLNILIKKNTIMLWICSQIISAWKTYTCKRHDSKSEYTYRYWVGLMKRIKKLRGTNIIRLYTILSWSSVSIFNYIFYDGYVDELFEISSIFIFLYFNYASNPSDYSTFYEGLIDLPCYKIISDQLFYTVMLAVF